MYNEERKMRFMKEGRVSQITAVSFFTNSEPYEQIAGKDLCELPTETLQLMIDHKFGIRARTVESIISFIRTYIRWCSEQGYPTCDGINGVEVRMDIKTARYMVASPRHLQTLLDEAFSPVENKEVDCIYRCYLWMAFGGMYESDAMAVKTSEVNFYSMQIEHGGKAYELYREAAPAFHNACELEEFVYKHPKYETVRKRQPGDLVVRGVRSGKIDAGSAQCLIAKMFKPHGIVTNFRRVRLSGVFYRMFERERMGEAVNFEDEAEGRMNSSEYSGKRVSSGVAKYAIVRDLKDDYAHWKRVYA